jgi:ADP-heptose:LPS heptosyltransferase/GT2 family glycosyltransferase
VTTPFVSTALPHCTEHRLAVTPERAAPEPIEGAEQPESDRGGKAYLHLEVATLSPEGQLVVTGWAICDIGIESMTILLDGHVVGTALVGIPRDDVAKAFPGVRQAASAGFSLRQKVVPPTSKEYRLDILIRKELNRLQEFTQTLTVDDKGRLSHESRADTPDIRFHLEHPRVLNGEVPDPVTGRLVIEGWTLARSGVDAVEIFLDERSLGLAFFGTPRRDVEDTFPDWEGSLRCGFIFHCPPASLDVGVHTVRIAVRAKDGGANNTQFQIDLQTGNKTADCATICRRKSRVEIDLYQDLLDRLACRPHFRLLLAVNGGVVLERIEATLLALAAQLYRDWHLLIVTNFQEPEGLRTIVDRIGLRHQVTIQPTADTSFAAPGLVGMLFPGDELGCDALAEVAIAQGLYPETDLFYADEDRISPSSLQREPFFKPDWSPDLLLSTNYIGRPWFVTAELLVKSGITIQALTAPHGDYDTLLRCTELTSRIHHLPKLLSRRDDDEAADQEAERRVLVAAASRRNIAAEVLPGCISGTWRLKRTTPVKGKVSIIIPTCAAHGYIATCLKTLRANTVYRNFEILCIDNIPPDQPEWKAYIRLGADKVVEIPGPFNWSRFNNRAAELADGEFLLFLNDDIEVQQEDWLDALLEHAARPEVGIVGPQLLYPNRKVQHAGIFLTELGAGRHSFRFLGEDDPGYFGLALTQRNVIGVTGACMLVRRDTFDRIGRFDEAHEVVNNDVDCCLRTWRAGLSIVYTPYAQLIHHELASRAKIKDIFDAGHFAKQWRTIYASGDPFFSPRLTKFADDYAPDTEPARLICAGRPLFGRDEIQRILAMKLDHIGDLITALPALRRLRGHFPAARIHLLASAAAKAFLVGEDCVDEVIEFEFFHARSDLGKKGITEDDLRALGERLVPYHFDLAIDLRKQLETRHVLTFIPARFRAGYEHAGRFPWLDIALQWEGDTHLQRKRSHVGDDLVRLVDAVAMESESDRRILPQAAEQAALPPGLPGAAKALFQKPVVAVHPGVGAIMRQWPAAYFASVIDLLIQKNAVNVVLVGGPDEADLAQEVLGLVVNRRQVASLAGQTSLRDLTLVLRSCCLYLGNNSGPLHIAAALGLPTIGIYSGVVDAAEWGPIGKRAFALQRDMTCGPCYLVEPEDCVRDMACLKRLEPAVVHHYCEMMLAQAVPVTARFGEVKVKSAKARVVAKSRGLKASNRPHAEHSKAPQQKLQTVVASPRRPSKRGQH